MAEKTRSVAWSGDPDKVSDADLIAELLSRKPGAVVVLPSGGGRETTVLCVKGDAEANEARRKMLVDAAFAEIDARARARVKLVGGGL